MKRVTLKDIAKEVGVSAMAVSKVLNDRPGVSAEVSEKIRETAKRLNYTPNLMAKGMRLRESKTIGVITSDSSHSFFPLVIRGIEDAASRQGYSVLLSNTNGDVQTEMNNVKLLLSKRVDGIILISSTLTSKKYSAFLSECHVPIVFAVRRNEYSGFDCVVNDNIYGARIMTDYLIEKGDRRIHFINLPSTSPSAKDRLAGYKSALAAHSIQYDKALVSNALPTIEDGKSKMEELLARDTPAAVFCGCDMIAIGAMELLLGLGYKIPGDIRLASYDNVLFSEYLKVPLTTVSQPKYEIGFKSAEILIDRIKNERAPSVILMKPELVVRQSC